MMARTLVRGLAASVFATALVACGGGGGTSTTTTVPDTTASTSTLAASSVATGENAIPVIVDNGPNGNSVSTPFISVTLCEPANPANCQTLDHILVDTGSTGLRIVASELKLNLPTQTINDGVLAECMQFADGYTWGSVRLANMALGGQEARNLAIQLIGDPSYPRAPYSCSSAGGLSENSVATFGAKGIIGVGPGLQDYGTYATRGLTGAYYRCTSSLSCSATAVPLAEQVSNPVALLPKHNNGVVLQLPVVPGTGSTPVNGTLVLGVDTAANNEPAGATLMAVNPTTFLMSTVFNGSTQAVSLVDSGTNTLLFGNGYLPLCTTYALGFYCPVTTTSLSATMVSSTAVTAPVNFEVANAISLFSNAGFAAFNNLGAPSYDTTTFIWGAPFFFGRSVWTVFEGAETTIGTGPFVAFKSL